MSRAWIVLVLSAGLILASPPTAQAARVTDVADAFDGDDVYDANLFITFFQNYRWAKVTKEFYSDFGIADGRDLKITEAGNHMILDVELGLYKDLSFNLSLPIAFTQKYGAEFANGVTKNNSELYGGWFVGDLDENPFKSAHAAGVGDMHIGLKWAPFNCERDNEGWWPTWMLYYDVMLPSGKPWNPSDDFYNKYTGSSKKSGLGVGLGISEMTFGTALSKRFKYFDPYVGFHYTLPILTSRSKISSNLARSMRNTEWLRPVGNSQERNTNYDDGKHFGTMYPGNDPCINRNPATGVCEEQPPAGSGEYLHGNQYPSEDAADNIRPHGRPQDCDPSDPSSCEWSADQLDRIKDNILIPHHFGMMLGMEIIAWEVPDKHQKLALDAGFAAEMFTEGVTLNELSDLLNRPTYTEQFAHFEGHFFLSIQAAQYVYFRAGVTFGHDTEHFLTYADEASNRFSGPSGEDLPDAYFDKRLDSVGQRVRVAETFLFTWTVTGAVMF